MIRYAKKTAGSLAAFLLGVTILAGVCNAQNLFAPIVRVNDSAVTGFEYDQRLKFLQLLNQPGDIENEAMTGLIDDRLRLQAADALGITPEDAEIAAGMEEFAGRANLSVDEFVAAIGEAGVAVESFRDFVRAGVAWRAVVRSRFANRVQITEAEIDRAIALSGSQGGVRVLMSEIIIPAPPEVAEEARALADRISEMTTLADFAAAAREYSASGTRGRGGRLDWVPIGQLPPPVRSQVLTLAPGQVTTPIEFPGGIALFQLRALEETDAPEENTLSVEYARYLIPGGRTDSALAIAERVRNDVDTCDDLYGVAHGQPEEMLTRDVVPIEEVPQDIALELAKLDENESSSTLTTADGKALVFLMLCGRVTAIAEDVSRDEVREQLFQRRIASYADSYLAELRAEATLIYPE